MNYRVVLLDVGGFFLTVLFTPGLRFYSGGLRLLWALSGKKGRGLSVHRWKTTAPNGNHPETNSPLRETLNPKRSVGVCESKP